MFNDVLLLIHDVTTCTSFTVKIVTQKLLMEIYCRGSYIKITLIVMKSQCINRCYLTGIAYHI